MLSAPNLASLGLCDILWDITAAMWKNTKTGHQPVKSPPTKVTTDTNSLFICCIAVYE